MTATLPYELIDEIAHFTDREELCVLARANSTFRCIAEPILYRDVGGLRTRPTIQLLRTLVQSATDRAEYLRHFSYKQSILSRHMGSFFRLLAEALSRMSRLDSLTLLNVPVSEAWVLEGCQAQPLTLVTSIPPCPPLASWLQTQTRMQTLVLANKYIPDWHLGLDLQPTALPNLRILCAKGPIIRSLAPNRPITHAVLDFTLDDKEHENEYETVKRALERSRGPLRTLCIQLRPSAKDHFVLPNLSIFRSQHLTTTKLADVTMLDLQMPNFDFFDAFDELGVALTHFPNLRQFRLSGLRLFKFRSREQLLDAPNTWRGSDCPRLTTAIFRDAEEECTFRWRESQRAFVHEADAMGKGTDTRERDECGIGACYRNAADKLKTALRG